MEQHVRVVVFIALGVIQTSFLGSCVKTVQVVIAVRLTVLTNIVTAMVLGIVKIRIVTVLRDIAHLGIMTVMALSHAGHAGAMQRFTVIRITVIAPSNAIMVSIFVRGDICVIAGAVRARDVFGFSARQGHVARGIMVTRMIRVMFVRNASKDGEHRGKRTLSAEPVQFVTVIDS